jgi:hypothetical protein
MATESMLLCLAATDHNCFHEMQQYVLMRDDLKGYGYRNCSKLGSGQTD